MSAWKPIAPNEAIKLLEAAEIGVDPAALLLDLAQAGLVKGYARLVSRPHAGGEVRDPKIDRDLWRQIISAGKGADVFASGSVRMDDVTVIAIRFDERSVRTAATEHGAQAVRPVVASPSPSARSAPKVTEPQASTPSPANCRDREIQPTAAPPKFAKATARPAGQIPEGAIVLDTPAAAAALCIGKTKLVSLANEGKIERRSVGRRTVYTVESIRNFLTK
ncbi:MAG TPA: hypothetical protein VF463_19070 [Sphingobium sp.]